jgi:HSP20 family protein
VQGVDYGGSRIEIHIGHPQRQHVPAGILLPFLGIGAGAFNGQIKIESHAGRSAEKEWPHPARPIPGIILAVVTIFPMCGGAVRADFSQWVRRLVRQVTVLSELGASPLHGPARAKVTQTSSTVSKNNHITPMRLVRYTYPSFSNVNTRFAPSPWAGLDTEIDRLFETAYSGTASSRFPVDIHEDKANTYVRAELPGVNRDDIDVQVVDGHLTINATRTTPAVEGQKAETFTLTRAIRLNEEVEADRITALYENGVLNVTLPKREEIKPKKITVAVK